VRAPHFFSEYDGCLKHGLVFIILCFLFVGTSFLWLRLDRSPPSWDDAYYLSKSLVFHDAFADSGLAGFSKQFLHGMETKPPLIAALPTPVYWTAGRRTRAAYAVNLAFLLVMFGALFWLGKKYASPRAGLIAIFIAGTMPILYGLSRWFLVECGLAAMVCVGICLIAEWNEFDGVGKALLLGAVCGIGLLMKMSFPLYVLVPMLYFAIRARTSALRVKTLTAFAVPAAALALPWYFFNFRAVLGTALKAGSAGTARVYGTGEAFSWSGISSYLTNLFNAGPTWYFIVLPLLLVAFVKMTPAAARRGLLLCALWGSPVLFLVFGYYRDLRYAAPLFPALALALAILIESALLRHGMKAGIVACVLLALPLLSMLQTSFGIFGNRRFEMGGLLFVAPRLDYARRYDSAGWPQQEILLDIYRTAKLAGGEHKSVILGTDSVRFNADNFQLAAIRNKLPFDITTTAYQTDPAVLLVALNSAAYFIHKEGGEAQAANFNNLGSAALKEVRESGRFVELPIARTLPDGGIAHVFSNRESNRFIQSGVFLSAALDDIPSCNVTFAGKLQLAGFSLRHTTEGLEVKLRWRSLKPVDRDYWCFGHVLDRSGNVAGYLDHQILNGDPPTRMWKAGDTALERLLFRTSALPDAANYRLRLGLFDRTTGERLQISSSAFLLTDHGTAVLADEQSPSKK
jgi:4-amino-4-deoxy-L-arabinose transferase-like glycosyltransferase